MTDSFNQHLQIFAPVITAIFLESAPFLCLGALVSALIEVYLPQDRVRRFIPENPFGGLLLGLGAGLAVPTCECAVVPIVRRLLKKGVPPHTAIPYMLAAPVINPIVLASTYVAFRGSIWMVLGRIFLVAVPAICIGLALIKSDSASVLRRESVSDEVPQGFGQEVEPRSRLADILLHTATEFLEMGKYLLLGAFAVGLFKVFVPQEVLGLVGTDVFLAIGTMMALAILLSICSEADAFVAVSFTFFPRIAQLSFVSIGPMVDLKLMMMYAGVFRRRLVLALIIVPILTTYLISAMLGGIIRWVR